jgi:hypothetical protein
MKAETGVVHPYAISSVRIKFPADAVEGRSGRLMCGPRAAVSAEHSGMARVIPGVQMRQNPCQGWSGGI